MEDILTAFKNKGHVLVICLQVITAEEPEQENTNPEMEKAGQTENQVERLYYNLFREQDGGVQ